MENISFHYSSQQYRGSVSEEENEILGRQLSQLSTTGDAEIKTQVCIQGAQASERIIFFQTG